MKYILSVCNTDLKCKVQMLLRVQCTYIAVIETNCTSVIFSISSDLSKCFEMFIYWGRDACDRRQLCVFCFFLPFSYGFLGGHTHVTRISWKGLLPAVLSC